MDKITEDVLESIAKIPKVLWWDEQPQSVEEGKAIVLTNESEDSYRQKFIRNDIVKYFRKKDFEELENVYYKTMEDFMEAYEPTSKYTRYTENTVYPSGAYILCDSSLSSIEVVISDGEKQLNINPNGERFMVKINPPVETNTESSN